MYSPVALLIVGEIGGQRVEGLRTVALEPDDWRRQHVRLDVGEIVACAERAGVEMAVSLERSLQLRGIRHALPRRRCLDHRAIAAADRSPHDVFLRKNADALCVAGDAKRRQRRVGVHIVDQRLKLLSGVVSAVPTPV